jgi:GTP cyclohydrolase I
MSDITSVNSNELTGSTRTTDEVRIARAVREILIAIGEDPDRPGLADTPARFAQTMTEMTEGLRVKPRCYLHRTFQAGHGELMLVRDIEFASLCEHHLLPFWGRAHVAYLPSDRRVVGVSKIVSALEAIARRPQVQERLGHEFATAFEAEVAPYGVAILLEAQHACMTLRGVAKRGAMTTTVTARGVFATDRARSAEVMMLLQAR